MANEIIWLSSASFASSDPTLVISYPPKLHADTRVRASQAGDFKWVVMPLVLSSKVEISAVHVCYQLTNTASFISQTRLSEMQAPPNGLVKHDDPTNLFSTSPTCYVSTVSGGYKPQGATTLSLRLKFGNTSDVIHLGAVGLELMPISGNTGKKGNS